MLEAVATVPRSVQLNAAIMGTGPAADSCATLVYGALGGINQDRFEQALRRACGEERVDPKDPGSPIREPGTSDHFFLLGALLSTIKQRGIKRQPEGFPLGSWKGRDGKGDGERNLFFVPGLISSDSPHLVIDIKDPAHPERVGAISLGRERTTYDTGFSGDTRLLPPDFRPNFGAIVKMIPQVHNVQVGDLPLQFVTQAALKQLGI